MNTTENRCIVWASCVLLALPFVNVLSPTLTGLLEIVLYLLFIVTPELRKRFVASLPQPMVIFGFGLYFIIMASSFWSNADWEVKLRAVQSCRKILLLPIAIALIDNSLWKDRFLLAFIFPVAVMAALSWISWLSDITVYKPAEAMLRNDGTQGMTFFVAAFASACMVTYHKGISLKMKIILMLCCFVVLSNSIIIATSRSGYLLGVVLVGCFGVYAGGKKSIFITLLLLAITAGMFYLSPAPHKRIAEGWENMLNAEQSDVLTSAGLRVIFWKNTLSIVKESPVIGHGLKGFQAEYAEQVAGVEGWKGVVTDDPHNQYLFVLAEQGALGFIALLAFIVSCFFQKTEPLYRLLGLSILIGWMSTSFFNGHFSSSVEGRAVLLWCAAMLSQRLSQSESLNPFRATTLPLRSQ